MTRGPSSTGALVLVTALAGCTTTYVIRPTDLAKLDGFGSLPPEADKPPTAPPDRLVDLDGAPVAFTAQADLQLGLDSWSVVGGRFSSIQVRDDVFVGQMPNGLLVRVPISEIRSAEVSVPSPDNNVALLMGIGGGAVGAAVVAILLASMFTNVAIPGRPLRIRGKIRSARARAGVGWLAGAVQPDVAGLSEEARAALASAWLEDARGEHAAVAAFSRLSMALMAVGAPARLIERTHRAAIEEIEHARLTFALASAYAGSALGPGPLPELLEATPASSGAGLGEAFEEIAVESLTDGCLNESVVAAMFRDALGRARDPAVIAVLAVLAHDEAAHAELAWEILDWCLAAGGEKVRRRLEAAAGQLPPVIATTDLPSAAAGELAAHGRLSASDQRDLFARVRGQVVVRASRLLGSTEAGAELRA